MFNSSERLKVTVKWLASEKGVTLAEIGKMLGYGNRSYFSQLLNGQKVPAADLPRRVAALDPRINLGFLLGQSDEPLRSAGSTTSPVSVPAPRPKKKEPREGVFIPAELVQMFSDMAATIRMQQETILRGAELQKKTGGSAG